MAKLNIELLKRLRTRFMRMRHKEHFDMAEVAVKTECGTAMCIAGHTLDLEGYKFHPATDKWTMPSGRPLRRDPLDEAGRLLGLSYEQSQRYESDLSEKNGLFLRFDLGTPKQAAAHIQSMIDQASQ